MKYIVVYAEHPSPSQEHLLRRALGQNGVWRSVLPLSSAPFCSEQELQSALAILSLLKDSSPNNQTLVFLQPSEREVPATFEGDVIGALRRSQEWEAFIREFEADRGTVKIRLRQHPRCWVVSASVPDGGMPPGLGFLIDAFTMTVIPRRFADVLTPEGELI